VAGVWHRLESPLGPARWRLHALDRQAETALDMMVDRSIHLIHTVRSGGETGCPWMIADSAMELYQCQTHVWHTAYKIDRGTTFERSR